jgi:hypothetical protein
MVDLVRKTGDDDFYLNLYRQIGLVGLSVVILGFVISFFIKEKDVEAKGDEEVEALGSQFTSW